VFFAFYHLYTRYKNQSSMLKKLIDAIKDLVQDGNFDASSDGLALQAMDSSHVSLVSMFLGQDTFETFRCDRKTSLGINIGYLSKVLKCADNDDRVSLTAKSDTEDELQLVFENKDATRVSTFGVKLMDIDSEHLGIPDTQYSASVSMPASEFQRICRETSVIGDTVTIAVTKEGVRFEVNGETGKGQIDLAPAAKSEDSSDKKDSVNVSVDMVEPVKLTFALRYLNMFAKATPLSDKVILSLSQDVPLVVEYNIGTNGYLKFFLAPKIEDEDE
jgi:proliferating cell nuclear antigen